MSRRSLTVAGGEARGLRLEVPPGMRPTSGRLRATLFDLWGGRVSGARVLDLFAGSGAVGIEAASRGAAFVVLVEAAGPVFAALERNLGRVAAGRRLPGRLQAVRGRLPEALERLGGGEPFDLVFADPPYGYAGWGELQSAVVPLLARGAELVLEHGWREPPPPPPAGLVEFETRRYGDSALCRRRAGRRPAEVAEVEA